MQAVGLRVLQEHKPLNNALNTIRAVMALTREKGRDLLLNSAIDKRIAELNKKLSVKGAEIKKLKNEIDLLRSRLLSSPSK